MEMGDMASEMLRKRGFWAHLTEIAPGGKSFVWECYEEAPNGKWTDNKLAEGDDAIPINKWTPPRFPWIVFLISQGNSLEIGPCTRRPVRAQLVVKEFGNSYAWRPQEPTRDGIKDAEDLPHSMAFEANGLAPPRLPYHVLLSPRYVPDEYMFYLWTY